MLGRARNAIFENQSSDSDSSSPTPLWLGAISYTGEVVGRRVATGWWFPWSFPSLSWFVTPKPPTSGAISVRSPIFLKVEECRDNWWYLVISQLVLFQIRGNRTRLKTLMILMVRSNDAGCGTARHPEAPSICRLPICFNRVSNLKLYRVGIQVSEWAGLPYASTDHFLGVVLLQNSEYTSLSLMKPPNAKQERLKDTVPVPVCNLDDSKFPWDRLGRPFSPHRPLEGELTNWYCIQQTWGYAHSATNTGSMSMVGKSHILAEYLRWIQKISDWHPKSGGFTCCQKYI